MSSPNHVSSFGGLEVTGAEGLGLRSDCVSKQLHDLKEIQHWIVVFWI